MAPNPDRFLDEAADVRGACGVKQPLSLQITGWEFPRFLSVDCHKLFDATLLHIPDHRTGIAHAMVRTLVVEDDPQTALYITQGLSRNGHTVYWAPTGGDGFVQGRNGDYDLIIADRMLPGMDGLTLIRRLRGVNIQTPVLFLTNMGELDARVEGLEAGGDDYITKPFAMPELLARTNALVRRAALNGSSHTILRISSLEVNLLTRTVTREGMQIDLQAQEFKLLQYLMEHSGRVVTRTMLLENVWGLEFEPGTTVVESHMSRLRSKIDKGFDMPLIHTVRGAGYVLRAG